MVLVSPMAADFGDSSSAAMISLPSTTCCYYYEPLGHCFDWNGIAVQVATIDRTNYSYRTSNGNLCVGANFEKLKMKRRQKREWRTF